MSAPNLDFYHRKVRIGISGFGRIGRFALRYALTCPNVEIAAINNRNMERSYFHYLFTHDSVHGPPTALRAPYLVHVAKRTVTVLGTTARTTILYGSMISPCTCSLLAWLQRYPGRWLKWMSSWNAREHISPWSRACNICLGQTQP